MKTVFFCTLFLVPFFIYGQFNGIMPWKELPDRNMISAAADYYIDSKNLTNKFINTYRTGGYISVPVKEKVLTDLDSRNTLGGEANVSLYYRNKTDSVHHLGWYAGLSHTGIVDARFSRDLFHLYFYGNKPFAGKTADFGSLSYKKLEYQQLKAGVYKLWERTEHWSLMGIGIGYVNGQDIIQVKSGHSSLYTAADATSLNLMLDIESMHADSASHRLGSINGSGITLSWHYEWVKKNGFSLSFSFSDLGFIRWNKNTSYLSADTNYYFDGVQVNNLLDSLYLEVKSVENYRNGFLKENKNKTATTLLPAMLQFSLNKRMVNKRLLAGIEIRYRFATLQIPIIQAHATWLFNKNMFAGLNMQYGGYGSLHAGIKAGLQIKEKWVISAGTGYLDGILTGRTRAGQGGFIQLNTRF